MKTLYQPQEGGAEKEAILGLTSLVDLGSDEGSRVPIGTAVKTREGPEDESIGGLIG